MRRLDRNGAASGPPSSRARRVGAGFRSLLAAAALGLGLAGAGLLAGPGCNGWDPRAPFEHNAPEVDDALHELDAGRVLPAETRLERYLKTGPCTADAGIALSTEVRQKPDGTFDLGLTLFSIGEQYGLRFGDEEKDAGGGPREQALAEQRATEIGCALLVVRAIAADPAAPTDLRARARYLAGNLEFLRKKYEDSVKEYDQALALVPGLPVDAGGDGIGRDAAWNRAIALRRIDDQKDAGNDAPDASDTPDASDGSDGADGSSGQDGGDKGDAGQDGGGHDDAGQDGGQDGGDNEDGGAGDDGGAQDTPPPPPSATPSTSPQQDTRMLEMLEQHTPSYQEQEAKQRAHMRRGRSSMEDK